MTEAQMRELVSATFLTGWSAARTAIPAVLEDDPLPAVDTFAQLTITPTTSMQMTQGAPRTRRIRRAAWAVVKLWVPAGTGAASVAAALIDVVKGIFELQAVASPVVGEESANFEATSQQPVGIDGRWYMVLARTPLWWSETK